MSRFQVGQVVTVLNDDARNFVGRIKELDGDVYLVEDPNEKLHEVDENSLQALGGYTPR